MPQVRRPAREPHVHRRSRIDVAVHEAQQTRVVVVRLEDAREHRVEVERRDLHADAQALQIVLDDGCHTVEGRVAGADEDRERNRRAAAIGERAVGVADEARLGEQLARGVERRRRARDLGVRPQAIARRHGAPERRAAAAVGEAHEARAVDRERDRPTESLVAEPRLLRLHARRRRIILVEEQEVVLEARPEVLQHERRRLLIAIERRGVLRADAVEDVHLAGAQPDHLRFLRRHDEERDTIQIGQARARAILLPVVRILREDDVLAGPDPLDAERTEPRDVAGRRRDAPRGREAAVLPRAVEPMARQHRDAVEDPLGCGVRRRQIDGDRPRVDLADRDRLAADEQQIALRRMQPLVQIRAEAEDDIVGVEHMAVGEAHAAAQAQHIVQAVGRNRPRCGERRLGALRLAVDVNEVGLRAPDHVARLRVEGDERIERLRLAARGDNERAAARADLAVDRHQILARGLVLDGVQARRRGGKGRGQHGGGEGALHRHAPAGRTWLRWCSASAAAW